MAVSCSTCAATYVVHAMRLEFGEKPPQSAKLIAADACLAYSLMSAQFT
jgi:hypothetical protein